MIALYNPLLEDTDTKIIEGMTKVPKEPVPSLVELSARAIYKHALHWKPGDLPRRLEGKKYKKFQNTFSFKQLQWCYTIKNGVVTVVGQYSTTTDPE